MLKTNLLFSLVAATALLTNSVISYATTITAGAPWSYHGEAGPQNWGKLDTQYSACANGRQQSPVNISSATLTSKNPLKINYTTTAAQAVADANSILTVNGKKLLINNKSILQINMPKNAGQEFITINNKKYSLTQLHFHTPSENLFNNKHFPLEIHFVNQSADGELALVSVMITQGNYNTVLASLLQELPKNKKALAIANKLLVNVAALLPPNKSYYSFTGSLTTPPCSEKVKWFVLTTPLEAAEAQIDQLKTLLPPDNARPVQPLNGREIAKTIVN